MKKILVAIGGALFLYLLFSFSLFLGLQVKPMYGNIGIITTGILAGLFVWYLVKK